MGRVGRAGKGPAELGIAALVATLLALTTLVTYAPALRSDFVWDDEDYVENNLTLRSREGLYRIWFDPTANTQYYPLTYSSFWLDYHLWGADPFGFHLVNVLLHATAATLLWLVLRWLAIPGALLIAFLFALHPVHVESVAWITERKNVLSGTFYLAAVLAWLRFLLLDGEPSSRPTRWGAYALSLLFFACALLAKTVTCSLPAVLLLVSWWKCGRVARRDVLLLAPMFVIGGILASSTALLELHHVGVEVGERELGWIERFLVAGRALWFYAGKLVWPDPLVFVYPRWEIDQGTWWQYLYPLAALGVILALWLARCRLGTSPLVCVLLFAGTLLPALGFLHVYYMRYSFVADHFQYLASVALLVLAGATWARWTQSLDGRSRAASQTAAVLVCVVLAVLSWRQAHAYENRETLWRDVIAKNPTAWIAFNNLGFELLRAGKPTEAIPQIARAIELKDDYYEAYGNLADAYKALGRPGFAKRIYFELGQVLLKKRQQENAAAEAETAQEFVSGAPSPPVPPGL